MSLFISTSEKQRKGDERQSWLTPVNTSLTVDLSPPGFHTSRAERERKGRDGSEEARSVLFLLGKDNFQPGTSDLLI